MLRFIEIILRDFLELYIEEILERFRMSNCKPIDTLVAKGENLSCEICPNTSKEVQEMSKVHILVLLRV